MKNLKVKIKMLLLLIAIFISIMVAGILTERNMRKVEEDSTKLLESTIRLDYDQNIKEQVNNVISLLQTIYGNYEKGIYTLDEAKLLAANLVREIRYKDGGYFWIDTLVGDNVVLLGKEIEGTNRLNATDVNGYEMVKEIIRVAQEPDGGYTDYVFPKEGETESSPKRSYSKVFEPFGWVVGTGNYTDYIDDMVVQQAEISSERINQKITFVIITLSAALVFMIIIAISISLDITKSLESAIKYFEPMANGDFTQVLPARLSKRKDDFGVLGAKLNEMRDNLCVLIRQIKESEMAINEAVTEIETNVVKQNEAIESVSATTEELAASMEETAATSENIVSISNEIEMASKSIASRSQEGSDQAADIYKRAVHVKKQTEEQRNETNHMHKSIKENLEKALMEVAVVSEIEVLSASIMDITNQTNLLSLNAAIEAARAGEAGRGFSVVADEIRGLAEKSKETVVEIQRITEKVTESVNNLSADSSKLLEFVATEVMNNYNTFGNVAEQYNEDAVDIEALITDFSAASEELLASVEGVLSSINGISKATNEGAIGTTDIAERAADIMLMSTKMTDAVSKCVDVTNSLHERVELFQI
ncbi:methyl-accepting chemotaxis protein [Anaeromicropila populeti]|uniref:Methyl-accepting chemotaxis sensory transducer with Cache sensor n=1 Tax=Anaeromicropila populeti TaxID=37658 RepID=A0A1I6ILN6_9FIRM|nr:methyl-accepting chemotaxis protein [Anaeromicropila populeti]SFR67655.1 methyl-accepting chemotaxis sensory transducer with Cache sensor [Anaeromicropila populeti]